MSMIKYVSPSGWDWDRPVAVPVKYSGRGLIGADRQDFIKTASHAFLDCLDNIKVAKDEVPIHIIALGASEAYGANRNGDAFSAATCKKYHPTFTKFARWFRNHKNKPEKGHPHFGLIKASAWNEPMKRVELLAVLNAEKSACDRNGGFVADRELEKLASGEDLATSMACRVPYDECSWCGNKAPSRKQYCTLEKCAAGGCKDNLTRVVKVAGDMHHLHVKNTFPTWFDMSDVFRPADRISYGCAADYLTKAAADNGFLEVADAIAMAEDATAPLAVCMYQDGLPGTWSVKIAAQMKLGHGLAAAERQERNSDSEVYRAFDSRLQSAFDTEVLGTYGTEKAASALGALADRKIILSIRDFGRWLGKDENFIKAAAACLPGIYQRMIDDDSWERRVEQNKCPISEKVASATARTAANLGNADFSLEKEAVQSRIALSSIRGYERPNLKTTFEKSASDQPDAEEFARDYAVYKADALQRIAGFDQNFPLTARLSVRQNHVM